MKNGLKLVLVAGILAVSFGQQVYAMGNSRKDTSISPNEDSLGTDRSRSETGSYAGTQVPEPPKEPEPLQPGDSSTPGSTEATPKYSK